MSNLTTNTRLHSAVKTILRLTISETSENYRVSLTTTQKQYTFSQQLSPRTLSVLVQFIRAHEPNVSSITDGGICTYLALEGKTQLEKRKKAQMRRHRNVVGYFFFLGFMIPMGLISQAAEDANVLLALPLMIGAVLLCWFNRSYYYRIKKRLKNDQLTLSDCEYVYSYQGIMNALRGILYFVCVLMVVAALLLLKIIPSK